MKCSYDKESLARLLTLSLGEEERRAIESHVAGCRDCQRELKAMQRVWSLMGEIPQPQSSDNMRAAFSSVLSDYKHELQHRQAGWNGWKEKLKTSWSLQPKFKLAYGFGLLFLGLTMGFLINRPVVTPGAYNRKIDSLSGQVVEMKQMMMLSLLQNPSASQRMRAVGYTEEMDHGNKKVIQALLTTLNEDPDINVRLMTLDALVKLAGNPAVREGLVQSITQQDSPLMQSAIADVMVKLQEKRSVKSLQELLQKKDLNGMVKEKIEQSIHKLI